MRVPIILFFFIPIMLSAQQPTRAQIKQVEDAKKEVKKMKGQKFPDFELTSLEGKNFTSENTKGKYVLFNFWFTSCGPCIEEMPELNELVEEFSDKDVVFVAPTWNETPRVEKFLNRFQFEYEIVADVKDFCVEMNVRSYPTHFIVNPDGVIEKVMIGYLSLIHI